MTRPWHRPAGLAGLALSASLAACSNSSSPSTGLGNEQTSAIGGVVRDDAEDATNALSVTTAVQPYGLTFSGGNGSAACVAGSSTLDSDGDGVPDNTTYDFTAPPCSFGSFRGGSFSLTGRLIIQDPTPSAAGFGYTATIQNLIFAYDGPGTANDYTATGNGNRTLSGTSTGLTLSDSATTTRTFSGQLAATIVKTWSVSFSPATPLQINQPLPSGTITIDGTLSWTRGSEVFAMTMTTQKALAYDATCTNTTQRIKDGELRAAGTFNGKAGYVRISWSACGTDPQYQFFGS